MSTVAIDIALPLKVKPVEIAKYLSVSIGSKISEGIVLACKKPFLGFDKTEIQSPVAGIVANIDTINGTLIVELDGTKLGKTSISEKSSELLVKEAPKEKHLKVNAPEKDTELLVVEKPKLETTEEKTETTKDLTKQSKADNGKQVEGLIGFGHGEGEGLLIEHEFSAQMLVPEMQGKILLLPTVPTVKEMYKACAVGVTAIVASGGVVEEGERLEVELHNKIHMGFILLPDKKQLASFHNKHLVVNGEEKVMLVG
ncbi:MAG: hypothetical protein ACOX6V_00610 [Patescibacteria group bacterium]|jgi:hypothetical protein